VSSDDGSTCIVLTSHITLAGERERQTDRQTDRQTETDRQRQTETDRQREGGGQSVCVKENRVNKDITSRTYCLLKMFSLFFNVNLISFNLEDTPDLTDETQVASLNNVDVTRTISSDGNISILYTDYTRSSV
jgi:hypothetical protein